MEVSKLRIGFAYDRPLERGGPNEVESVEAEYEDNQTISWMRSTLHQLGTVVDLPWGPDFLSELTKADIDVIFNITEARGNRNRESLVPALAEAKGIPYTGTDAVGLGISLDKYLTKIIARHTGIPTPDFIKLDSIDQLKQLEPELKRGLSPYYSLFPMQARAAGVSPEDVIHQLIKNALMRDVKRESSRAFNWLSFSHIDRRSRPLQITKLLTRLNSC